MASTSTQLSRWRIEPSNSKLLLVPNAIQSHFQVNLKFWNNEKCVIDRTFRRLLKDHFKAFAFLNLAASKDFDLVCVLSGGSWSLKSHSSNFHFRLKCFDGKTLLMEEGRRNAKLWKNNDNNFVIKCCGKNSMKYLLGFYLFVYMEYLLMTLFNGVLWCDWFAYNAGAWNYRIIQRKCEYICHRLSTITTEKSSKTRRKSAKSKEKFDMNRI